MPSHRHHIIRLSLLYPVVELMAAQASLAILPSPTTSVPSMMGPRPKF